MPLTILDRFDATKAHAILAGAALIQNEHNAPSDSSIRYRDEINELLKEVRIGLKLSQEDTTSGARKKIDEFLSKEIVSAVLGSSDLKSVQDHMGIKGDLPIGGYQVTFQKDCLKDFKEDRGFIERCIRTADEFQHVYDAELEVPDAPVGLTLFAKRLQNRSGQSFWLIVDTMRQGASLSVASMLRVFPHLVDISGARTPLDMLRQFVSVYGFEVSLDGSPPKKLVENLVVKNDRKAINREVSSFGREYRYIETGFSTELMQNKFKDAPTIVERRVIASYAVDIKKYLSDKLKYL